MNERTITGREPSLPPHQFLRNQDPEVRRVVQQIADLFGPKEPGTNNLVLGAVDMAGLASLERLVESALKQPDTQTDLMTHGLASIGYTSLDLDAIAKTAVHQVIYLDSIKPFVPNARRYTGRPMLAMVKASHQYLDFHGMKRHDK